MILRTTRNNWPKFNVYLVSKTCLLISIIISSKVFFVVTCSEIINYWFTSPVWSFSTSWVVVELLSILTQLLYNKLSLTVASCFLVPPCCSYLTVSMNESHRHSFCYQSLTPLALIGSLSLNTCFDYWLWVVTTTTTLIGTLPVLGSFWVLSWH